ncbi:MAG: selenide, water dikinase SelD [Chloroflexi bacterium]|nr:selenide, water dikinase SelD [Chloroflexota bacterium]
MADLAYVLRELPTPRDPNLLVGANPADDAAVYRVTDDLALIQTVDFFTPVVDDPYTYGQIAAANSLSDVYAMGGTPLTALNIVGFPVKTLPAEALSAILRGGADKAAEAGVPIVGGHTVEDQEPKYGLAVTGTVHPDRYLTAHGARPGDMLVLTKPLGSGVIATALKVGAASEAHVTQAVRWMTTLNRSAAVAMMAAGAHAATDVTGYGLLGHLVEMCRASGVAARVDAGSVPLLPGALDYARAEYVPGGTGTNLAYVEQDARFGPGVDAAMRALLADPQTSGGLLICLAPDPLAIFLREVADDMLPAVIGEIEAGEPGRVAVEA